MRIGIVCYPSYGGSGVIATELAKHLADRGHVIHLISYDQPFRLEFKENVYFHEVDVPTYPLFKYPPYLLSLSNKMVEVARHGSLDLFHVHYAVPHAIAGILARKALGNRVKVVTTLHGTDITLVGSDPSFAEIISLGINESDGITAVSDQLVESTRQTFGISREIRRIYNFVDPGEYQRLSPPGLRERYTGLGKKIVIHISNFRPVKRVPAVLEIFARVIEQVPAHLVLLGEGPEMPRARQVAARLGLCHHVSFLGRQDRVVELLSVADVLLLPSTHESFGLVALEAMACEVPVVGSKVGGLSEVVQDGEVGYLLEPDRLGEMAERTVEILLDDNLRTRLGRAGRRRAVERFNAHDIVGIYESYYREVLSRSWF